MDDKRLWSEVNKIIKRCERRKSRSKTGEARSTAPPADIAPEDPPLHSRTARQKKYDVFMLAVEDIMRREQEVRIDVTLHGDMARAFHITMAIGKYLWNKDEDSMVQAIMQAGVEHIINEHNSEVMAKEARKVFKPILREILRELEDEEI